MSELTLGIRIKVNADGSAQVLGQTSDGINRISNSSGNASHNLRAMASNLVDMGEKASANSQRLTAGMTSAATSAQIASKAIQASTGSMTAGMAASASAAQISAATIANSLQTASSVGRASMQSMTESMVVNLHSINATLQSMDARLVATGAATAGNLKRTESAAGGAASALGAMRGTIATLGLAALAVDLLRTVEQIQNIELRLKGLTKSASDYAGAQEYLSTISKQHHKNNLDMTGSFAGLLAIEQTGIITRQQSKALLEGLSNVQSATGASADALKSSTIGLSQALSMGTLQWEEMKQVTEPLPGFMVKIAEAAGYTGKSAVGDFKAVVSAGQITSDMFGRIMVDALASYEGAAAKAGGTVTAHYSDIKNAWIDLSKELERPVSDTLTPILNAAAASLNGIVDGIKYLKSLDAVGDGGMRAPGYVKPTHSAEFNTLLSDPFKQVQKTAKLTTDQKDVILIGEEYLRYLSKEKDTEKEITKSKNDAASATKKHAEAIAHEIATLNDQHLKLSLSERDYELSKLAALGMSDAVKASSIAVWDSIQALESQKKGIEAGASALDAEKDRYDKLTMSVNEYLYTQLLAKGVSPGTAVETVAQAHVNDGIENKQKGIDDARSAMEQYAKSVDSAASKTRDLEATNNALFDSALGGISTLAGAFSNLGKTIATNTDAYAAQAIQAGKNSAFENELSNRSQEQIKKNNGQYLMDLNTLSIAKAKTVKESAALDAKSTMDAIAGSRQIAGAVSKMFAENSKGRQAMHNVETTLAVIEMALSAKKVALELAGFAETMFAHSASIAPFVAGETVKAEAAATTAVAEQAGAGPYIGFAMMAAMAAAMVGLGLMGGKGSGSVSRPALSPETGTVLGDPAAGSNSVDNIYTLLKDIQAQNYPQLHGINAGVGGLRDSITQFVTSTFKTGSISPNLAINAQSFDSGANARAFAVSTGISVISGIAATGILGSMAAGLATTGIASALSAVGLTGLSATVSGGLGGVAGSMAAGTGLMAGLATAGIGIIIAGLAFGIGKLLGIGKTTVTQTGGGIQTSKANVGSLLTGEKELTGQQYAVAEVVTKGWFSDDKTTQTIFAPLSALMQKNLAGVGRQMAATMFTAVDGLGQQVGQYFVPKLMSYVIPAITYETFGLTAEKATKRLDKIISTQLDKMSTKVFDTIVAEYQKKGEGAFETISRLSAQIAVVEKTFELSGMTIFRSAMLSVSDALAEGAGGLKEFKANVSSFYEAFTGTAQKQGDAIKAAQDLFKSIGAEMPKSRKELIEFRDSLDLVDPTSKLNWKIARQNTDSFFGTKAITGIESNDKARAEAIAKADAKLKENAANIATYNLLISDEVVGLMDTVYTIIDGGTNALKNLQLALLEAQGFSYQALIKRQGLQLEEMALKGASEEEITLQKQINTQDSLNKTNALEIELLKAEGLAGMALIETRKNELKGYSDVDAQIKKTINIVLDASASLAAFNKATTTANGIAAELASFYGDADKATALTKLDKYAALESNIKSAQDAVTAAYLAYVADSNSTTSATLTQSAATLRLEESNRKGRETLDDIKAAQDKANKTRTLEIELLNLSGASAQALASTRNNEIKALSATGARIKQQIYTLQDFQKAVDESKKGTSTAMSVLQKSVDAEKKTLTDRYNAGIKTTQDAIDGLAKSTDKLKGLSSSLKSFLDRLAIPGNDAFDRATAQSQISAAIILARTGGAGAINNQEQLIKAADVLGRPSESLFATFLDYQNDFIRTANDIATLSGLTDTGLSVDERQLRVLQDSLDFDKLAYDKETLRLDGILSHAQQQIDAVNGATVAVMSVSSAIDNLSAALFDQTRKQSSLASAQTAQGGIAQAAGTTMGSTAETMAAYIAWDGRTSALPGYIPGQPYDNPFDTATSGIPSFAVGINDVPYDMFAKIHQGERIFPEADNRELMMRLSEPRINITGPVGSGGSDNAELIAEIKALRAAYERQQSENERLRTELEKIGTSTRKTSDLLIRVTHDGESLRMTPA
jgi:tape measure domain-containing protein